MAECIICDLVEGKIPIKRIYEDDEILAFLDFNAGNIGHSFVVPKKHIPIFEQVPDELVEKLFKIANKVSTALFETLKIDGTNIFITNGVSAGQTVAHFTINVIPRKEKDGINLQWEPKQLSEEEMSTVELKIKESAENVIPKPEPKQQTAEKTIIKGNDENYLWKSMNRRRA